MSDKNKIRLNRSNNIGNEKILFQDYNGEKYDNFIYPILAGITYSDPKYYIARAENDPCTPYMYVMEYVTDGKGYIVLDDTRYVVEKGDFYLLSRNTKPVYYADYDHPFQKKFVNICGRFINGLCLTYNFRAPVLIEHINVEAEIDKIHGVLSQYQFSDAHSDHLLIRAVLDLFERIRTGRESDAVLEEKGTFEQISKYIKCNINLENLSVSFLSSYFRLSNRTLDRMFSKHAGLSPAKYIVQMKIQCAKQILLSEKCSIEALAEYLNFSDAAYFRRVFIEHCGKSPIKWKKEQLQKLEEIS